MAAVTLDGFVAAPDGGDPSGSPAFPVTPDVVEHLVTSYPETLPAPARAALGLEDVPSRCFDTVVEGRASYEIGLAAGLDDAYPHLRHVVFSRSLPDRPDLAVEVVATDPVERLRELKGEPGLDIWLVGGGTLAHALLPEIDRLVLKVNPTVLGDGVRLFAGPETFARFDPVDQVDLPGGVRVLTLDRSR